MLRLLILQSIIISAWCHFKPKDLTLNKDAYLSDKNRMCLYVNGCDDTEKVYICASNGKTYDSQCAFRRAACKSGSNIDFKHTGKCTVKEICLGQRNTALKNAKQQNGVFIPVCKPDGSYDSIQCHNGTGYCWCSTSSGKPIGTAKLKLKGALDCSFLPELPVRRNESWKSSSYRPKEGCAGKRRRKFNRKMVNNMVRDFKRESYRIRLKSSVEIGTLQWKFLQMDVNSDGKLNRKEYRTLQKLVKRNMKPRRCAKKFPGFCDLNGDEEISLKEWIACFTTSGKDSKTKSKGRRLPGVRLGISDVVHREPCFRDRDQAMELSKNGNNQMFVPSCNKEGYYKRVQCYGSTGKKLWYCFCVDVKTGIMNESTSIKNGTPNCSVSKKWPRCPPPRKEQHFLTALLSYFIQQSNSVKSQLHILSDVSKARLAVKSIFNKFDQNKNSFIEKKEIKRLRKFVRKNKKLKRCGGKIHIVCDANEDRKLSETELMDCVLPRRGADQNSVIQRRKEKKLKGKNPFIDIIKAE